MRYRELFETNSNGKPVAHSPEGISNFWKWFGDSKVVDSDGNPLVVYHGTGKDFDKFDHISSAYFFGTQKTANHYAYDRAGSTGTNVVPVYLKINNPCDEEQFSNILHDIESLSDHNSSYNEVMREVGNVLLKKGFDGVRLGNNGSWLAFRSNQIKSAIGNNGNFSNDERITEEILNEFGREAIDPEKLRHIVKNPSAKTLVRMYNRATDHSKGTVLRGLITEDKTLYFWDAYLMTHGAVTIALGLPYDTGRLYVYNYMNDPLLVFTNEYTLIDFAALLNSDELLVRIDNDTIVTANEAKALILSMRD